MDPSLILQDGYETIRVLYESAPYYASAAWNYLKDPNQSLSLYVSIFVTASLLFTLPTRSSKRKKMLDETRSLKELIKTPTEDHTVDLERTIN